MQSWILSKPILIHGFLVKLSKYKQNCATYEKHSGRFASIINNKSSIISFSY